MTRKLIIDSHSNEDWIGQWNKEDVEKEMRELDLNPTNNDWIEWVLDHVFSEDDDFTIALQDMIITNNTIASIALELDNGNVTISKIY